jgi:organizing structure protein 2
MRSCIRCSILTIRLSPTHVHTGRIKSIISPSESFTPGLLYVGVATLTGSILARTRTLPTRILLPPSLLVISLHHFLPATAHNLSAYFTELEETYFPSVAAKHAIARAHTRMAWEGAKETLADGRERVKGTVEGAVRGVQLATGLKLREGLGWGGEAVKVAGGGVARSVGEEAEGLAEHTKDFKPVA